MSRASLFVPLGVFVLLLALFVPKLLDDSDPRVLPSALLDRAFPAFSLPRLDAPATDRKSVV